MKTKKTTSNNANRGRVKANISKAGVTRDAKRKYCGGGKLKIK